MAMLVKGIPGLEGYLSLSGAIVRRAMEEYIYESKRMRKHTGPETPDSIMTAGRVKYLRDWFYSEWFCTLTCSLIDPEYILDEAEKIIVGKKR